VARDPKPWYRSQTDWWMAVVGGVRHKLVKGRAHKEEAKRKLQEIQALRDMAPSPEARDLTVAAVIDLYLEHAKSKYAARSLDERRIILQAFAEAHGFRTANERDAKPFHLTAWLDANPQWQSEWTKAHVVAVVQRPFNWAVRQRLIAVNPFRGASHRKGKSRRPMTDDEFEKLVAAAKGRATKKKPTPGERFVELMTFLRLSGARTCEAGRLRWSDIDLENAVIVLRRHKTTSMQREPKPRVIPLLHELVGLPIAIRTRQEPGDHVFRNHRGTPWNRCNLSLRMQRMRARAGVPDDAKLYRLRHAFGTRAVVNGVDIKTLAEIMGHTTTRWCPAIANAAWLDT
jgi:integrase